MSQRIALSFIDRETGDLIAAAVAWDGEELVIRTVERTLAVVVACQVCGSLVAGGTCRAARTCGGCRIRKRRLLAKRAESR